MSDQLLQRVLVPVASIHDAKATCDALIPYCSAGGTEIIAVHVIEKAGGSLDKASVEQRELETEEMFDVIREHLGELDIELLTEIRFGTSVAHAVVETAHEMNVSSIAFTPRGGSKWVKLLAGDVTTELINESDVPIVVLPDQPDDTQS